MIDTTYPVGVDVERLTALRHRLAHDAEQWQVAYRTVPSPIGDLLVATTPAGLVRIAFDTESGDDVLVELAGSVGPRVLWAPARLDGVARELDEYFSGARRHFDVALDLHGVSPFRTQVLTHLRAIEYGQTRSYAAIAHAAGSAKATRAVGTACATNPVPLVIPCHRVTRADGSIGHYRGGKEAKKFLLTLEQGHPQPVNALG